MNPPYFIEAYSGERYTCPKPDDDLEDCLNETEKLRLRTIAIFKIYPPMTNEEIVKRLVAVEDKSNLIMISAMKHLNSKTPDLKSLMSEFKSQIKSNPEMLKRILGEETFLAFRRHSLRGFINA